MSTIPVFALHLAFLGMPTTPGHLAPAAEHAPEAVVADSQEHPLVAERPIVAQRQDRAHPGAKRRGKWKNLSVKEKRAKIRERIRALRAWRLTEALDLDEQTAAELFPILNRYDAEFAERTRQGRRLRGELRAAIEAGDDRRIDERIDRLVKHQKELWELQAKRFRDVRKVLTPEQSAELLILLPKLDRAIRGEIRKVMHRRRGGPRGRPGRHDGERGRR